MSPICASPIRPGALVSPPSARANLLKPGKFPGPLVFRVVCSASVGSANGGFQQNLVGNNLPVTYKKLLQNTDEDLAMVGLDSIESARSSLEEFCRSYFMFHGLDVNKPQSIFKYLPFLIYVESYIYKLDDINEKLWKITTSGESVLGENYEDARKILISRLSFEKFMTILEQKGLLTERIKEELVSGEEYWALERKICQALMNNEEIHVEDVIKSLHLKSFDLRTMDLLLYKLRGAEVEKLHMEFIRASFFLAEISDDLSDYEEDVLENKFNVLRCFIRIYGASAAPAMLLKYINEGEEKYDKLLKLLDPQLQLSFQKRCEEAIEEGGIYTGYSHDTWNIPTVIMDEELYRSKHKSNLSELPKEKQKEVSH